MSKDQNPYLTANPFSKLFHSWISSLLSLRRKRPLEYSDRFDVLPDDQSEPWIDRLEKHLGLTRAFLAGMHIRCAYHGLIFRKSSSFQLRDVTFSARTGDLIIVIGSIASGKSSLLMTLLGEMKMIGGAVKLNRNARFRYVPQAHEIRVVSHNVSIDKESPNAILQILNHNQENQLASGTYSQLHQMCPEFKQWTQANTNNPRLDSSSASYTTGQLNSSPVPEFVTQLIGLPTSPETEKLLLPTTEKSVQKQTEEFKRVGSVSGRWSNAERIRYASKSTNVNCTIENHLPIRNMTMNAWFKKRDNYFYTLLGFVLLNIILLFLRTLLYFLSTHIAARTIHSQMFSSTLRAPIYFFDTNPIGRIINRCSKDISPIDEKLSETTYNFIEAFSNTASTISFIAYIQPVSLISLIFVGTILGRIRRFF
ncbi:unnamed protein product [Rotaria magnacalcarata]